MTCSQARLDANRANCLKSTGPRTQEGKDASRRNGLKHGLAGDVALDRDDADEVGRLAGQFQAELAPRSAMGRELVAKLAVFMARAGRCARHEQAMTASRVRHAVDDFDEERHDRAGRLLDEIGDDPRGHLRRLRRMPEGVDALAEAWLELRADLTREGRPTWTASHRERAEHLSGWRVELASGSRIDALTRAIRGDFAMLADHEGGDLDDDRRSDWARRRMLELIDGRVEELGRHAETLDLDAIEQDRAEAPDRALFDPSKEASLARRYEADAMRGFYKALDELREVEAEFAARPAPAPAPPPRPPLASSREMPPPPPSAGRPGPSAPPPPLPSPLDGPRPGLAPPSRSPQAPSTVIGSGFSEPS